MWTGLLPDEDFCERDDDSCEVAPLEEVELAGLCDLDLERELCLVDIRVDVFWINKDIELFYCINDKNNEPDLYKLKLHSHTLIN